MAKDDELDIEVLTPEGWRPAKLQVSRGRHNPLELGMKIEFDGKGIAMVLPLESAAWLAHMLARVYILNET